MQFFMLYPLLYSQPQFAYPPGYNVSDFKFNFLKNDHERLFHA